ncbi:PREDICTED: uncharacterized protein LOC108562220, partial [Nicrophorus vespilloides]|uniref:Uncharacterized protein LOC108562220 n=1 Tax=Nicrophorus vespilloides TaxID=110193 RepID=A0ABM1MN33_NICVS
NDLLKEELEAERKGCGRYRTSCVRAALKRSPLDESECAKKLMESREHAELLSQFQKGMEHLSTCKRKKCSVCSYTKSTFGNKGRQNKKLFSCLQTPFMEVRNMLKPPPSPVHGGTNEGESLSEWFCPLEDPSECSSLSLPFAELAISYMDDGSDLNVARYGETDIIPFNHDALSHLANNSTRGFGSDSGFSSDVCADYKSDVTTPKEKFSPKGTLDDAECAKLTRTKWTASFRKLINKIKKSMDGWILQGIVVAFRLISGKMENPFF